MMKEPAFKKTTKKINNGASQTVGLKVKKQSYKRASGEAYVGHSFETAIFIIDDYTNRK